MQSFRLFRAAVLTLLLVLAAAPALYAGDTPAPSAPSPSWNASRLWDWLASLLRPAGFAAAFGCLGHDIDPNGGFVDLGHEIDPNGIYLDLGHEIDPNG